MCVIGYLLIDFSKIAYFCLLEIFTECSLLLTIITFVAEMPVFLSFCDYRSRHAKNFKLGLLEVACEID